MRWAVVKAGKIENVILWDGKAEIDIPVEDLVQHDEVEMDWLVEDGQLVPPPPPPPMPEPIPQSISFAQLLIGLVSEGWITPAEGRAWRDRVALPLPVQALINEFPEGQRFAAETRAMAPSTILRADPLVVGMGAAAGKTPEEIDTFFRTYATV